MCPYLFYFYSCGNSLVLYFIFTKKKLLLLEKTLHENKVQRQFSVLRQTYVMPSNVLVIVIVISKIEWL